MSDFELLPAIPGYAWVKADYGVQTWLLKKGEITVGKFVVSMEWLEQASKAITNS